MSRPLNGIGSRQLESLTPGSVRRLLLLLLIMFLLLGLGCQPAYRRIQLKEVEWEEINVGGTPSREDYPGASAVFLLDEGEFSALEDCIFTHHVIIKILDEAGLDYANVEITFDAEDEVHNIKGRTIRGDGSVVQLQPESVHEKSIFPDYILYSDSKAKVFALPGAEVGSVLEYSYSIVYEGPFPAAWEFQREEPVLLSSFTLDVPAFIRYDYLLSQRKEVEVEKSVSHPAGRTKAQFKLRNAPPIVPEPFMPARSEITTKVYFSLTSLSVLGINVPIEGDSWEILGQNYCLATEDKMKSNRAIRTQTREIVEGCTDETERMASIYDFVQSKIRYVAIEIKEGRVMPHDPSQVFTNKYGDCKDKAFLLVTMLRTAGIDAHPVLARTNNSGEVIDNFVSAQQFNHVVAAVPADYFSGTEGLEHIVIRGDKEYTTGDDYVLLDATSGAVPFGQIPWYLEGTRALLLKEEASRLMRIPSSSAGANSTIRDCRAEVLKDGSFLCSVKSTKTGQEASSTRALLQSLSKTEQKEWFEYSLSRACPGAVLKEHSISDLFELDRPLILNYRFLVSQYAQEMDTFLVFCPGILRNPMFDELTREQRTHSIRFDYPRTLVDGIKVKVPSGLAIAALPDSVSGSSQVGDYSFSCFTDGESIVLSKQVAIRQTQVARDSYEDVKSFFESILASQRRNVTLLREHE